MHIIMLVVFLLVLLMYENSINISFNLFVGSYTHIPCKKNLK